MTRSGQKCAQLPGEIAWLAGILRDEGVRSLLEIGALYGDTLWTLSRALPPGARLVAVDLPGAGWGRTDAIFHLRDCIAALRAEGFDATLIEGDSRDEAVLAQVTALAPFDAALIDGDHTLEGVTADWRAYGPLARLVAFHDIDWRQERHRAASVIEVPILWRTLRERYPSAERIDDPGNCGIGVIWRDVPARQETGRNPRP